MITDHFEIYGPNNGTVEAWAAEYVRHQAKDWQKTLATEITTRCGGLRPEDGQILHATFFGEKKVNADVENLVLYNIGAFGKANDNGIRFELGGGAMDVAPSGRKYPFFYRYELVAEDNGFKYWQEGRKLATFDWTELNEFKTEKLLVQVWLAIARAYEIGKAKAFSSELAPGTTFTVKVQIRPPREHLRVLSNMVKGVVDGVVSAFQSHTDLTIIPEVLPLLMNDLKAAGVEANSAEIERHLYQEDRGVLGKVPQLVSPSGKGGVKWSPADHLCVAGELIRVDPPDHRHWAIRGEVIEITPWHEI